MATIPFCQHITDMLPAQPIDATIAIRCWLLSLDMLADLIPATEAVDARAQTR